MSDLKRALNALALSAMVDRRGRADREVEVSFAEKFEHQRRDIGQLGFQLSNKIVETSKVMIAAIKAGDHGKIEDCKDQLRDLWDQMGAADLPADIAWQFDSEAGAELSESFMVASLYPLLFPENEGAEIQIPSYEDLKIGPPAWLAGIGDSISELAKLHTVLLMNPELDLERRIALRQQYLKKANEMYAFLDQFETCYGMVINHTRRKGFGQTYRGMLFRISMLIQRESEDLARVLDFRAAIRSVADEVAKRLNAAKA